MSNKDPQDAGPRWLDALQRVFARGMTAYAVWATFLVLVLPLLFSER